MMRIEEKIEPLAAEFRGLSPRERLELLLEFAEQLPPLPEHLRGSADKELHRVAECQTPVFLWLEPQNGQVMLWAEVAPEAPTVKGFVAILAEIVRRASLEELAQLPGDLLQRLGLSEALGVVRLRGLTAIVQRVRSAALEALARRSAASEMAPSSPTGTFGQANEGSDH
jgi:cysteine desulfuration protein SufE